METKWLGLWKQERSSFYAGQVIKKKYIPNFTRLIVRHNKFWNAERNTPRYVYCFANSEEYKQKCVPVEEVERKYTRDEVQYAINRATEDALRGYTDNIVEDYL